MHQMFSSFFSSAKVDSSTKLDKKEVEITWSTPSAERSYFFSEEKIEEYIQRWLHNPLCQEVHSLIQLCKTEPLTHENVTALNAAWKKISLRMAGFENKMIEALEHGESIDNIKESILSGSLFYKRYSQDINAINKEITNVESSQENELHPMKKSQNLPKLSGYESTEPVDQTESSEKESKSTARTLGK